MVKTKYKITQEELSQASGVNVATIRQYVREIEDLLGIVHTDHRGIKKI